MSKDIQEARQSFMKELRATKSKIQEELAEMRNSVIRKESRVNQIENRVRHLEI